MILLKHSNYSHPSSSEILLNHPWAPVHPANHNNEFPVWLYSVFAEWPGTNCDQRRNNEEPRMSCVGVSQFRYISAGNFDNCSVHPSLCHRTASHSHTHKQSPSPVPSEVAHLYREYIFIIHLCKALLLMLLLLPRIHLQNFLPPSISWRWRCWFNSELFCCRGNSPERIMVHLSKASSLDDGGKRTRSISNSEQSVFFFFRWIGWWWWCCSWTKGLTVEESISAFGTVISRKENCRLGILCTWTWWEGESEDENEIKGRK